MDVVLHEQLHSNERRKVVNNLLSRTWLPKMLSYPRRTVNLLRATAFLAFARTPVLGLSQSPYFQYLSSMRRESESTLWCLAYLIIIQGIFAHQPQLLKSLASRMSFDIRDSICTRSPWRRLSSTSFSFERYHYSENTITNNLHEPIASYGGYLFIPPLSILLRTESPYGGRLRL